MISGLNFKNENYSESAHGLQKFEDIAVDYNLQIYWEKELADAKKFEKRVDKSIQHQDL